MARVISAANRLGRSSLTHGRQVAGKLRKRLAKRQSIRQASDDRSADASAPMPPFDSFAIAAFLCATVGWALFGIGSLVGCFLGWMALSRIEKSEAKPRGRGLALFAALQAPVFLVTSALGIGAFLLWDNDLVPVPLSISVLILAAFVFVGIALFLRLAKAPGLWQWRKKSGASIILLGTATLAFTTWALEDRSHTDSPHAPAGWRCLVGASQRARETPPLR